MADLTPDSLKSKEYAAKYGWATQVIFSNKEIRDLFKQAVQENWTDDEFEAQVRATAWYKNNDQYARNAWTVYQTGGADAAAYQDNAKIAVQSAATALGVRLTEKQLNQMATRYNTEGWKDRPQFMQNALAKELTVDPDGDLLGSSGDLQESLRQLAAANGIGFSNDYYIGAARSVASNLSTAEDWARDIRQMAATLYPTLSDKINQGLNVKDLASSYINMMAQTFEVDPDQIDLSDPHIKEALGAVDDKGNPRVMGLGEFQDKLRDDPRWMGTKQALSAYSQMAVDFGRRFGVLGG